MVASGFVLVNAPHGAGSACVCVLGQLCSQRIKYRSRFSTVPYIQCWAVVALQKVQKIIVAFHNPRLAQIS